MRVNEVDMLALQAIILGEGELAASLRRAALALAMAMALAGFSALAWAQDKPFAPGGPTVSLAATGTTGAVQVQTGPNSAAMRVYNSGSVAVFLACGVSGVVATVAAGMPIAPGTVEIIGCNQTYVAGITGGTAATVYVTPGNGI